MLSIFSYLITIFGIFFWGFRVIVSLLGALEMEFFCQPINGGLEILILFVSVPCIIFIIKRSLVAATIYFGMYTAYFGQAVYETILQMMENGVELVNSSVLFVNILGVLIPLLTFLDILLNKNRRGQSGDKKTDIFYKGDRFDREYDVRADKNQYKF